MGGKVLAPDACLGSLAAAERVVGALVGIRTAEPLNM